MIQALGLLLFVIGGTFILTGASVPGFGLGYLGARLIMAGD